MAHNQNSYQPRNDMTPFPVPLDDLFAQLPSEDRSNVSKLQDPDAVSRWALSRADDYRRRITELLDTIATLCSIHNAVLPIRRLPTEIVSQVFANPILNRKDLAVTQVSRHWRAVVLDTPQFWANVLASVRVRVRPDELQTDLCARKDSPLYLELCVSRSGALPLRIEGCGTPSMWKLLKDVKDRVCDLDIRLDRSLGLLQGIISSKMTRLTRLKATDVFLTWDEVVQGGIVVDAQLLPRLRNLNLVRIRLLSMSTHVPTLTHLELGHATYSLPRLVGVLKRCPRLESLTLSNITIGTEAEAEGLPHDPFDAYDADNPVALPRLSTLSIIPLRTAPLLTCLTYPPSTRLSLQVPFRQYPSILEAAPSWVLPTIESDWLHIFITDRGLRFTVTFLCYVQQREKLRLTTKFVDPPGLNNAHHDTEFLNSFQSIPITTLSLDLPSYHESPYGGNQFRPAALSAWLSLVLEALPRMHTLELLSFVDNSDSKRDIAEQFLLDREERNVGGLTLVWALPPSHRDPIPGSEIGTFQQGGEESESSRAATELQGLLEMLRARNNAGKVRLQRLELRRPDHRGDLFKTVGRTFELPKTTPGKYDDWIITELRGLVDELVLDLS